MLKRLRDLLVPKDQESADKRGLWILLGPLLVVLAGCAVMLVIIQFVDLS